MAIAQANYPRAVGARGVGLHFQEPKITISFVTQAMSLSTYP
jgi:hypothetical protein